jgi:hypothetical protein
LLIAVFTAITFQSNTTSAFAAVDPNNSVTINPHTIPKIFLMGVPSMLFMVFPPSVQGSR